MNHIKGVDMVTFQTAKIIFLALSGGAIVLSIISASQGISAVTIALIVISLAMILSTMYLFSDRLLMSIIGAGQSDEPMMRSVREKIRQYCAQQHIPTPVVSVVHGEIPDVYVEGISKKTCFLVVTSGAVSQLDRDDLGDIAAKELAYVQRYRAFDLAIINFIMAPVERLNERSLYAQYMRDTMISPVMLNERITLRKARDDDFLSLYRMGVEAFKATTDFVPLHRFACLYKSPAAISIVAEYGGKPVGFIVGHIQSGATGIYGHVDAIVVDARFMKNGIGAALTGVFLQALVQYGCRHCCLEVWQQNAAAIKLYEKIGFVSRAVFENYYKKGQHAQVMCKILQA